MVYSRKMVLETSKGKAYYCWTNNSGYHIYLIVYADGRELWTNSMQIVKDELLDQNKQLLLF
jgi:hypothetical protein